MLPLGSPSEGSLHPAWPSELDGRRTLSSGSRAPISHFQLRRGLNPGLAGPRRGTFLRRHWDSHKLGMPGACCHPQQKYTLRRVPDAPSSSPGDPSTNSAILPAAFNVPLGWFVAASSGGRSVRAGCHCWGQQTMIFRGEQDQPLSMKMGAEMPWTRHTPPATPLAKPRALIPHRALTGTDVVGWGPVDGVCVLGQKSPQTDLLKSGVCYLSAP